MFYKEKNSVDIFFNFFFSYTLIQCDTYTYVYKIWNFFFVFTKIITVRKLWTGDIPAKTIFS